jgi:Calcium/calmodulin dependent protein kinase II association domain
VLEHYAKDGKVRVIAGNRPVLEVLEDSRAAVQDCVKKEVLSFNALLLDAISAGDWQAYESMCLPSLTCFEPEANGCVSVSVYSLHLVETRQAHSRIHPPIHPPPSIYRLVEGLAFHKHNFDSGAQARSKESQRGKTVTWTSSSMESPRVRLLTPHCALVTYVRVISVINAPYGSTPTKIAETRVWQLTDGKTWKLAHVHRSHSN